MTRDSPDRSSKPRLTLGDLTNQLGKRGFALISRSPATKSAVGNAENANNKENDTHLAKRISIGSKDSGSEISGAKRISIGSKDSGSEISGAKRLKAANPDKSLPLLKGGKTYRLHSLGNADSVLDSKLKTRNQFVSAEGNLVGSSNLSQSSSESSSKDRIEIGGSSQDPRDPILEDLGSQVASTEGKDCGVCTMPSTESPPVVGSGLTKLHGSRLFELERCKSLKDDPASGAVPDADSLKACSCSFCVKAAYIWSDLQYTDVKGRLSALTKSKKEASTLARMCSVDNDVGRSGESSGSSPLELDMDLMSRCKSLFVFMEDAFNKECSQLETDFSSLKDIRENFKMNTETLHEMHPDTQQIASDDSAGPKIT